MKTARPDRGTYILSKRWIRFFCDLMAETKEKCIKSLPNTLGGGGESDGAMVLGKLPVPGRPTNLHLSRARAYCACNGCG